MCTKDRWGMQSKHAHSNKPENNSCPRSRLSISKSVRSSDADMNNYCKGRK